MQYKRLSQELTYRDIWIDKQRYTRFLLHHLEVDGIHYAVQDGDVYQEAPMFMLEPLRSGGYCEERGSCICWVDAEYLPGARWKDIMSQPEPYNKRNIQGLGWQHDD